MTTIELLSPIKAARRDKILDAAERLFARDGFRATTVEGIAAAADMSKATLYSYFGDKDAMFAAASLRLVDRVVHVVRSALASEKPLPERVVDGFVAKFNMCFDELRSSPFATEFLLAGDDRAMGYVMEIREAVKDALICAMREEGMSRSVARANTRLLTSAVQGISSNASNYDEAVADIRKLVFAVL